MTQSPSPAIRMPLFLLCAAAMAVGSSGCEHTGLMKTPNLYLASDSNPFAELPDARKTVAVDLIYATDRTPLSDPKEPQGTGVQFGHGRGDSLSFGRATVALGEHVTWGDLEAASLTRRRERRFVPHLVHTEPLGQFPPSSEAWRAPATADGLAAAELARAVDAALEGADRREAFVFVHGYNNQFYHATLTMAQLWHFMGRPGVPVVYSWPAGRGGLRGYTADSASSVFTVFHFKQFLRALAAAPGLDKIHILAHSRGTDVATVAIKELLLEYRGMGRDPRAALKLGNLVLAAPDLDLDIVNQSLVAEGAIFVPEQFTVYLSQGDRALRLSSWLTDSFKRLGSLIFSDLDPNEQAELSRLPNMTFIDADVESDITGHAYFWINPAASSDVILLLRDNAAPGAENGRPLVRQSENFWLLKDDYLLHNAGE